MKVYNNPKFYEIAFSFRDISTEVDFIEQLIKTHSKIPAKVFFELASGNSPHMKELCNRGYQYIGLELNDEMVAYARDKIKQHDLDAKVEKGDLVEFSLSEQVDCALLFLGSLYIKSDQELEKHLNSLSKILRLGGLYILDGAIEFYPEDIREQSWEMEEAGIRITTLYNPKWIDRKERIVEGKITLEINDHDANKKIEHSEIRKIYSKKEFIKKVEQTNNWEYLDSYSNFNVTSKPKPGARNIIVLRRK